VTRAPTLHAVVTVVRIVGAEFFRDNAGRTSRGRAKIVVQGHFLDLILLGEILRHGHIWGMHPAFWGGATIIEPEPHA
jgi:hypothetical protein